MRTSRCALDAPGAPGAPGALDAPDALDPGIRDHEMGNPYPELRDAPRTQTIYLYPLRSASDDRIG